MQIKQIYETAISLGLKNDLRGQAVIEQETVKLRTGQAEEIYPDSLIISGRPENKVKKILAGIDVGAVEIASAKYYYKNIDLIISHHPLGAALNGLPRVVGSQTEILKNYGVAEAKIKDKINEASLAIKRELAGDNYLKEFQLSTALKVALMTVHAPADNAAAALLKQTLKNSQTLAEAVAAMDGLPEFKEAKKHGFAPFIACGEPAGAIGQICYSEITGGEESSPAVYQEIANAGFKTIIAPHLSKKFFDAAKRAGLNVIFSGDITTDSLGLNVFLDELAKNKIEIIACSGLIRPDN